MYTHIYSTKIFVHSSDKHYIPKRDIWCTDWKRLKSYKYNMPNSIRGGWEKKKKNH